ncbi:hypothetical protein H074_03310 [Amycolatopsis decaplanina DSM 44594]|uniref:Uncharacterized protein n=2 Tax=Amycolatopsis decaplanina TaxID=208441 RepID=M2ZAI5_9PSEU|nr:hypothetical protein H074_03310 [Amycolatopsis decaplanina DSM 44594]
MASIESALKNLGIASEEFELLTSKQQKKVRNRVLGHLRASSQTLNMASVARILEVHLSSGSDAAAPGG